jgi:hypothetical protein
MDQRGRGEVRHSGGVLWLLQGMASAQSRDDPLTWFEAV